MFIPVSKVKELILGKHPNYYELSKQSKYSIISNYLRNTQLHIDTYEVFAHMEFCIEATSLQQNITTQSPSKPNYPREHQFVKNSNNYIKNSNNYTKNNKKEIKSYGNNKNTNNRIW